jgi:hypothetical protein
MWRCIQLKIINYFAATGGFKADDSTEFKPLATNPVAPFGTLRRISLAFASFANLAKTDDPVPDILASEY